MNTNSLLAVSPIDGRYCTKTEILKKYFSEYALIRYRVRVEIEYFITLCRIPLPELRDFGTGVADKERLFDLLRGLYLDMTPKQAQEVKDIEKITNHDVKAIEYYIKNHFKHFPSSHMDNCDN